MRRFFTILSLTLIAVPALLSLSACNTVEGVGQDIQRGGQSIERAAE